MPAPTKPTPPLYRSGLVDPFARDRLPPRARWPDLLLDNPSFHYPERLNCVSELVDTWLAKGHGAAPCLFAPGLEGAPPLQWSYAELAETINRIANVLTQDLGMVSGNRVLLRAPNTPMLVAIYLAILKAGGIVVATMPMLRAGELVKAIDKARIDLALCDHRLVDALVEAQTLAPSLQRIVTFGAADSEIETRMATASPHFTACDTAQDDVCLLGFTSGTTGGPKATMHFHRDVLAIADGYANNILHPTPADRFIGSPPLAFTFGLGGLVIFPLRFGASSVLLEKASPDDLLPAIRTFKATISFTAPTAYRAMAAKLQPGDLDSLRACVSAGEGLPLSTFDMWHEKTGLKLLDGIGATEMLHIFIAAPEDKIRPGATGLPVPGYEARVIDEAGNEVPRGTQGLLAVRGPVGCRYLDDPRQSVYVRNGWNVTGDTYLQDQDGYFWYQARSDDMIVSAGYNISGPEVEQALLTHPLVAECAVIGTPDPERGRVVSAFIVRRPGPDDATLEQALKDHVKAQIAPYKYPRKIVFVEALPKTASGKLQRSTLRSQYGG